ncbi:MAG: NrdH-redoxin [Elusimicrobia bacterium RIFOXYA2_FULL_39_19]|nr:MAG: NrdH-redoxin [Elusimicrobia bacterium RIFOXYA2_FULL_39_19]
MSIVNVSGKKAGNIMLYALSTCVWCRRTKQLLNELAIEYSYVDVDLLEEDEKAEVKNEIKKWNPEGSFPTIVIDNKSCVTGYDPDKVKKLAK